MRLKLALLAIPIALLAALFVYFVRPQLGATPAVGSSTGAPSYVANPSSGAAPAASTLAGVASAGSSTPAAAGTTSSLLNTITVTGQGQIKVAPDVAYVSFGVQTRASTAKAAQDQNNQAMAAAIAKIKALGIADADIQTSGINLYPVYDQSNTITGYQAGNTVTVTVDVAKAGDVIDAAVGAGANTNVSVSFGLKDPSAATDQALEAAAKAARAHADAIAKGLGVTIQQVQLAVEQTSTTPVPVRDVAVAASSAAIAPTPVQAGQLTVSATVQVTYSY